jgi:hypothetical protein
MNYSLKEKVNIVERSGHVVAGSRILSENLSTEICIRIPLRIRRSRFLSPGILRGGGDRSDLS